MVTLEQVRLLESRVAKAIDFVERVTGENVLLQGKLDSYQKRIDELEVLIQQFREDQGRIEDGILSALDRLNQFEDTIEKSISPVPAAEALHPAASLGRGSHPAGKKPAAPVVPAALVPESADPSEEELGLDPPVLFSEDLEDPLYREDAKEAAPAELPTDDPEEAAESEETSSGELDIF
ncbi:hypothetical protein AGMMS49587_00670 [Spirochaetia bacterium]|nr:hypothetical protein AGMMS49587_00670 [Spirochaetia bacterium]